MTTIKSNTGTTQVQLNPKREKQLGGFLIDDRPKSFSKKTALKLKKYLIKQGYIVSLLSEYDNTTPHPTQPTTKIRK